MNIYADNRMLSEGLIGGTVSRHAGDMRDLSNQNEVFGKLGVAQDKILHFHQTHSDRIIHIASDADALSLQNRPEEDADAWVFSCGGWGGAVQTADCVPLFLYDPVTGVFGTVHSGWKGTGIIGEAVKLAQEKYGSRAEDMCVAIGPHIGKECYCIDEERKDWFLKNFGNCVCEIKNEGKIQRTSDGKVLKYSLDLTEANLFVLKNSGVKEENIVAASDCTCCSVFSDGSFVFGSFRRQAAFLPDCVSAEERSRSMTVQAAFVI